MTPGEILKLLDLAQRLSKVESFNITISIVENQNIAIVESGGTGHMDAMDLSSAQAAAAFILSTAAPYALRQMTEGALKELGKQGLVKVEAKAKAVWRRLRGMFTDRPRLAAALADYETAVQGNVAENELSEARTNLENDLRTRFTHHPDEMVALQPLLRELFEVVAAGQVKSYGSQAVRNAKKSIIPQVEGDGNTIIIQR